MLFDYRYKFLHIYITIQMREEQQATILLDSKHEDAKIRRKLNMTYAILTLLIAGLIATVTLAIVYSIKYSDQKNITKSNQDVYIKLQNQEKVLTIYKQLNLSQTTLEDFQMGISTQTSNNQVPKIDQLLLTNNLLQDFSRNALPTVSTILLDYNSIESFQDNVFGNLTNLSVNNNMYLKIFMNNTLNKLSRLDLSSNYEIIYFQQNNLPELSNLLLNSNIKYINSNNLPRIQNFNINEYINLISFSNNSLNNLRDLSISSSNLESFEGNDFTNLKSFLLDKSKLKSLSIKQSQSLQSITITYYSPLQSLEISNLYSSTKLNISNPNVKTFLLNNTLVKSFDNIVLPNLVTLELQNNNLLTDVDTSSYSSLQFLRIVNSNIDTFPSKAATKSITFINTALSSIQNIKFTQLKALDLEKNKNLKQIINNDFLQLTSLVLNDFNLNANNFINNTFSEKFITLDLSRTDVRNFDFNNLQALQTVKNLILDSNNVTSPFDLTPFKNIVNFTIKNNNISQLEFKNFINLNNLELDLIELVQLKIINSSILPNEQSKIPYLEILEIDSTPFTSLSGFNLDNLISLTLKNNSFKQFSGINFNKLKSLTLEQNTDLLELSLSAPQLSILKLDLENLQTLELLKSSLSNFTTVLNNLKTLSIQSNHLTGTLELSSYPLLSTLTLNSTSLSQLIINNTQITDFSASILPGLASLIIDKTPLTQMTGYNFPKLLNLIVVNNPVENFIFNNNNFNLIHSIEFNNINITELSLISYPALYSLTVNSPTLLTLQLIDVPFWDSFENINIQALESLHIENTSLKDFSQQIFNNLNSITLIDCPITSFQANTLPSLTTLKLKQLQIQNLQINFPSLTSIDILLPTLHSLIIDSIQEQDLSNIIAFNLKILKIFNFQIPFIETSKFPFLVTLELSTNGLTALDTSSIDSLQNLIITNNPLAELTLNTNLESLTLSNLSLTTLNIQNLSLFQTISLELENLTDLKIINSTNFATFTIEKLPNLLSLTLDSTGITTFQDSQNELTSLKTLSIKSSPLENLVINPDSSITSLTLEEVNLENFNGYNLSNLATLILSYKQLNTFDDGNSLSALNYLQIYNSPLTDLTLSQTSNLQILFLNGVGLQNFNNFTLNQLTTLNIKVTSGILIEFNYNQLPKVTSISITNTNLTTIDDFPNLEKIYIAQAPNIQLFQFDKFKSASTVILINTNFDGTGLNNLGNVKNITIDGSPMTNTSFQSPQLVSLTISNTELQQFQQNITTLKELILSNNQIQNFTQLSYQNLQTLELSGNKLTKFENIAAPILINLDLSNNNFNDQSFTLESLDGINLNLQTLDLSNNNFSKPQQLATNIVEKYKNVKIMI